jgi:hypothetical protein
MALHRDIFWIGRQWAVTGFGLQAIDQRLKGAFDIAAAQVWADDLPARMQAFAWLNAADFDKALSVARTRFPEPPRKTLPLVDSVLELIQPSTTEPAKVPVAVPTSVPPEDPIASQLPSQLPPPTAMPALQASGRLAHFLPQWRIRH